MAHRVNASQFSPFLDRHRNLVERFCSQLKRYRVGATRYDKHAVDFLAAKPAASRIRLRAYESVTYAPVIVARRLSCAPSPPFSF